MNEQIRKLAVKSGIDIRGHLTGFLFVDEKPNVTELEKFAELIVKECAELSVNSQYANTKSEYYEGFNKALVYVGNKIKKHFGVE